ncbi:MAG TPA: VOC family protein [Humisphaera sp.]
MSHATHNVDRQRPWTVAVVAVLFWLLSAGAALAADARAVTAVSRVGMTVDDLDRSAAWYADVLDFRKVAEIERAGEDLERLTGVFGARARTARLRLGDEELELTEYLAPRGRAVPPDSRSNDRWFQHVAVIVSDMDAAYARLRAHKVRHASPGPQRLPDWNPAAGGIRAFYFHDPDGHLLEVLQFPPGKGDPKWRDRVAATDAKAAPLFLGIDHTAIVVADTDRSLQFYRDVLGMGVVGTSENFGEEQERLNNVFGARLRITTLAAVTGPKVELLEYLSPRTGRDFPADSRANDLWHWQTTVAVPDVPAAWAAAREARQAVVSTVAAPLPQPSGPAGRGFVARDPDGHALLLATMPAPMAGGPVTKPAGPATRPAVGDAAPDFALRTPAGEAVSLVGRLKSGPVVLVVLRGWPGYQCPICTRQVGELVATADAFAAAKAHVVLVYPGPAEGLRAHADDFAKGKNLPGHFDFVLDPDYAFTNAYGLRWDAKGETAYPSTFVIGTDGRIRYAVVSNGHGGRAPVADVLRAIPPAR